MLKIIVHSLINFGLLLLLISYLGAVSGVMIGVGVAMLAMLILVLFKRGLFERKKQKEDRV